MTRTALPANATIYKCDPVSMNTANGIQTTQEYAILRDTVLPELSYSYTIQSLKVHVLNF